MRGVNIVATLHGRDRNAPPLLLGAHYDSVIEAPCADDNAAAVVILLELAARLRPTSQPRDIVFAFFDAEEPPHFQSPSMGSRRFHADQMDERGVQCAVVLDLVGHEIPVDRLGGGALALPGVQRLRDLLFVTGAESHPLLQRVLSDAPAPEGLHPVAARNEHVGDMSDHGVFRLSGIPYLFLSCGRWEHYHMPSDTPDRLAYRKMARQVEWLERLVPALAAAELDPVPDPRPLTSDPACIADTTRLEVESLKRALGPLAPALMTLGGLSRLETREDLDRVARLFTSAGI